MSYGANVPFFRESTTSNDDATTFDVIKEVENKYERLGKSFKYTCCFYPCGPFVTDTSLIDGLELLKKQKFDTVFPAVAFGNPVQRSFKKESDSKVSPRYPEFSLTKAQDLEVSYQDAGQFYNMNTERCMKLNKVVTDETGCIIISEMEAQDIDNIVDWKLAELKYNLIQRDLSS